MSRKPTDSSDISFTALYTGTVWCRYGLSDDTLAAAMAKRPGSVYLSESYYQPRQPVLNPTLKALEGVLGAVTRGEPMVRVIEAGC